MGGGGGWGSLQSSEKMTSLHPVLEIRRMCIWQPHVKLNVAHKSNPVSLNITALLHKDLIPSIKVIIVSKSPYPQASEIDSISESQSIPLQ